MLETLFSMPLLTEDYAQNGALVTRRTLSQLAALYEDREVVGKLLEAGDPVVYEVYELPHPHRDTDLLVNLTKLYPGRVGAKHYMTKGHFHAEPDSAEAVIGLSGSGVMLVQRRTGELRSLPVEAGRISYAGGGWGHRVVNTGDEPLVFFAVSGANIVHDYETAARLNFK